jgi:DNA repair protein RecO (recombination protein O)
VLRVFEKRLLEAAGYGLVLDHIAHSSVPVEPQTTYHYVVDRGPCLAEPADSRSIPITGATLLALAAERIEDERCLYESKKLMRFALQPHLGTRPLESRRLLDLL